MELVEERAGNDILSDVADRLKRVSAELSQTSIRLFDKEVDEPHQRSTGVICWKIKTDYYSAASYHRLLEKLKRSLQIFLDGRETVVLALSFYDAKVAVEITSNLLMRHLECIVSQFLRTEVETLQDFEVLDRDRLNGFSLCNFYGDYLCYFW